MNKPLTRIHRALRAVRRDDCGGPVLEFALLTPVLLTLVGGTVDFSLAYWTKGQLAGAVAEGAAYALTAGTSVTKANVQCVVAQKLSQPCSDVTVTGPALQCLSTAVPSVASSPPAGGTCADGTAPGTYVTISARVTYNPVIPAFSGVTSTLLTETAQVRVE